MSACMHRAAALVWPVRGDFIIPTPVLVHADVKDMHTD